MTTSQSKREGKREVLCPYCGGKATLTSSTVVYGGKDYGPIYLCDPCWAWVGCHQGTYKPLGRLANAELRTWKQAVHRTFDAIWKRGPMTRKQAYAWLAKSLGIEEKDCHIGMFDVETCKRVITLQIRINYTKTTDTKT